MAILWPHEWKWGIDVHVLLAEYIECEEDPATLNGVRRDLAYYIEDDKRINEDKLKRLWRALRVAVIALGAEVAFWLIALGLR